MSRLKDWKAYYQNSLKSMDTEETFDLIFYRPLGYLWAIACAKVGITPNAITIASIFIGIGSGVALYFGLYNRCFDALAVLLLVWANTYDSADGQLARLTKNFSPLGRILDGVSSIFWFIAIYIAICLRLSSLNGHIYGTYPWMIWTLAAMAGISHTRQTAAADYYRQFHLYFLKGTEGSELDSVSQLLRPYVHLSWHHHFWNKLTQLNYITYTEQQEFLAPKMQLLRATLNSKFGGNVPKQFCDDFRKKSRPLMKYTNILSFNTRTFALMFAIAINRLDVYFLFELIVLNGILIYTTYRHEFMCRDFVNLINKGYYDHAQ